MNTDLKKRLTAIEAQTVTRRPPPIRVVTVSVTGERRIAGTYQPGPSYR